MSFHTITLEKATDNSGPAARGTIFTYTYKSLSRDKALQRASKILELEHKGEKRLNWREVR